VPGAKCVKVGQSQIVGGKKLTCIKASSKLIWSKGVPVVAKPTVSASANEQSSKSSAETSPDPSASPTINLVKYKNCAEVKAAGAAPLTKVKTPELYELNAGLDRDKDGIACES
jgi:hypothetical protein